MTAGLARSTQGREVCEIDTEPEYRESDDRQGWACQRIHLFHPDRSFVALKIRPRRSLDHLLDSESMRDHERLGHAVVRHREQFESARWWSGLGRRG